MLAKVFGLVRESYMSHRSRVIRARDRDEAALPRRYPQDAWIGWPRSYNWQPAGNWVAHLRRGLAGYVPVRPMDISQELNGAVNAVLVVNGREVPFAIDYADDSDQLSEPGLDLSVLYFKMQFRRGGYSDPRIRPGGFVPKDEAIYQYLPYLRDRARSSGTLQVYGRFGGDFARATRSRAIELLTDQDRFQFAGSLKLLRYGTYLSEIATSDVCVDLPGNGAFCFRLVEYLAIGKCVVAYPHANVLPVPLEPGRHLAYCKPDLSDLVDICAHFTAHPDERRALAEAGREYYDRHLAPPCLAEYYLDALIKAADI